MSEIMVSQRWPRKSAIPADVVENQWVFHYGAGAPDATAFDDIAANLQDFWTTVASGATNNVTHYINQCMSNSADSIELFFYDITAHLDGSPFGSPVGTRTIDADNGGDGLLPAEVSCCLSYRGPYGTDVEFGSGGLRPRARDRGRIYLPPLHPRAMVGTSVTKETFVDGGMMTDVVAAAAALAAHTTTTRWAQWSRAEARVEIVSDWWVDNAFDIQRRRGNKATTRVEDSV